MNHYPIHPPSEHGMWDSERIVELLASSSNVVAYLNGHDHVGNYGMA